MYLVARIVQGFAETHPCNPKVVSDMAAMHHIHEPGILHNLRERAKLENQRPNTFMVTLGVAWGGGGARITSHARFECLASMFKNFIDVRYSVVVYFKKLYYCCGFSSLASFSCKRTFLHLFMLTPAI